MDKIDRARCILSCLKILLQNQYGDKFSVYGKDDLHHINMDGHWSATISRRCSSSEAEFGDLPREKWPLAHIHVDNKLVLAIRFGKELEIIKFIPGLWEKWFGVHNPMDQKPYPAVSV